MNLTGEMGNVLKMGKGWALMVWSLRERLEEGNRVRRRCRLRNTTLENGGEVCGEYWAGESWQA